MYPRKITSLRHVWAHPAFLDEPETSAPAAYKNPIDVKASEEWLRAFCREHDTPSYEELLKAVRGEVIREGYGPCELTDEYFSIQGTEAHCEIPDEFWDHLEAVTGLRNLPRPTYFTCSC